MSSDKARPWQVLRRETVYTSPWVSLHRDDVRLPDGSIIDGHHVVDYPCQAVGVVPIGDDGRILMIEHYRFINDVTSWEIPAGRMDEGEEIQETALRELREETGYSAAKVKRLGSYHPMNGSVKQTFHVCLARGLRKVGAPSDPNEVLRVAWFTPDKLQAMIQAGELCDGLSLTGLLWYFAEYGRKMPHLRWDEDDDA